MPQSGASTRRSAATTGRTRRTRCGHDLGGLDGVVGQVEDAEDHGLAGERGETAGSSPDCAVSIETWSHGQSASSERNE